MRRRSAAPRDLIRYTQSAITQQIATLERIVGEKLVERPGGPRKVSLTEAGSSFSGTPGDRRPALGGAGRREALARPGGDASSRRLPDRRRARPPHAHVAVRRLWPRVEVTLEEAAKDVELLDRSSAASST